MTICPTYSSFFVSVMNITLSPTTYNWVLITCDNRCQHCFSYQWRDGCGHEDTSSCCFLASAVLSTQVGILIATIHTEDTIHIHIWTSLKFPPVFLQVLSVCHESICMTLEAIVLLKPLHAFYFFLKQKNVCQYRIKLTVISSLGCPAAKQG